MFGCKAIFFHINMFTESIFLTKVGQISRWNNKNNLGDLYPQPCDRLEGSAGEFFPQDQVGSAARLVGSYPIRRSLWFMLEPLY